MDIRTDANAGMMREWISPLGVQIWCPKISHYGGYRGYRRIQMNTTGKVQIVCNLLILIDILFRFNILRKDSEYSSL
jgi:hypothetical protein